jgi:hypothetical protein
LESAQELLAIGEFLCVLFHHHGMSLQAERAFVPRSDKILFSGTSGYLGVRKRPVWERFLVEQDMGVEPMSLAWKAKVIAVIPILQQIKLKN